MRILLISFFLVQGINSFGQSVLLYRSDFYRLNETDVKIKSFFNSRSSSCYGSGEQYRFDSISNDTAFLKILFDVRYVYTFENPCVRFDTLSTVQSTDDCSYINVSTGTVQWSPGHFGINPPDTIWNIFDSTFNAQLSIPEFGNSSCFTWNTSNDELTLISDAPLQSIELIDLNGKTMLYTKENRFDVAFLETGVYLMRVLTASGTYKTIRWYRP